jgi:hypothetical protein
MRRVIFLGLIKLVSYLIKICCYLNLPKLVGLLLLSSLRKNKLIKYSKKTQKVVIVLDKSFGSDDLKSSFMDKKSKIKFLIIQRSLIRVIFDFHFIKIKNLKFKKNNTDYFPNDKDIDKQKIKYRNFLKEVFKFMFKFMKIDGFLSFNLFYITDIELQNACLLLNKKFLVSHKESVILVDEVQKMLPIYWGKRFRNINISALNVYNKYSKRNVVDSKVLNKNKIFISGMPRADKFYSKSKNQSNYILFLMYQHTAGLPCPGNEWIKYGLDSNIKKFSWEKNAQKTTKVLLDYAKANPDLKFIFKTKPGFSLNQIKLVKNYNLNNIKLLVGGGDTSELIKNSSMIIGINTSGLLEGAILGKHLITTNFDSRDKLNKEKFLFKPKKLINYITNEKKFLLTLKNLSKNNSKLFPKKTKNTISIIKKHFGNTNASGGIKFKNFLYKNLNIN